MSNPTLLENRTAYCRFLTVRIADGVYEIPYARVVGIFSLTEAVVAFKARDRRCGVATFNEQKIPAINLRHDFGVADRFAADARVVIVSAENEGGEPRGLIVDGILGVIEFSESVIEPPPDFGPHADITFLAGIVRTETQTRLLLNLERIRPN